MSSRSLSLSLGTGLLALAFAGALVEVLAPRPLNVVLLTVESLRADAVSPEKTPHLWRIVQQGTRFRRHRAVSAWTGANAVSLLTGLSPAEHAVHTRGQSVAPAWRTPLETLAAGGRAVAGLQPFMEIDVFADLGLAVSPGVSWRRWLAERAAAGEPFVLWYHYLETHLPYAPSPPFAVDWRRLVPDDDPSAAGRIAAVMKEPAIPAGSIDFRPGDAAAIKALYAAGVAEFDAWFAAFWRFLEETGLRRNTVVVLTADHGEELLERGNVGHASTTRAGHLHEEIVRLPLVIWLPPGDRRLPSGARDRATDHLDIMPTVLGLLDEAQSLRLEGLSVLEPGARSEWFAMSTRAGYAEPEPESPTGFVFAASDGRWKLHLEERAGKEVAVELYDLDEDPEERRDRSHAAPEIVARLRSLIARKLAEARMPGEPPAAEPVVSGPPPEWVFPPRGGAYRYDDVAGRFCLVWSGPENAAYVIQYEVGEGLLGFDGSMEVAGPVKDFGTIDRRYWNTWIVPYSPYRVRVGYAGDDPKWSPWLELEALP